MLDYSRSILHILMNLLNFESLISQQAHEFLADLFQCWSMDRMQWEHQKYLKEHFLLPTKLKIFFFLRLVKTVDSLVKG